jgi:hypothetical protein
MRMLIMALALACAALGAGAAAQELRPEDQALRSALLARYDVVPLSDAIGLRPKSSVEDVRLIEVSDTISVNGVVVSGRECPACPVRDCRGRPAVSTHAACRVVATDTQPGGGAGQTAIERGPRADLRGRHGAGRRGGVGAGCRGHGIRARGW